MQWNGTPFLKTLSQFLISIILGADLAGDGGSEEAEEVAEERAVEVREPQDPLR